MNYNNDTFENLKNLMKSISKELMLFDADDQRRVIERAKAAELQSLNKSQNERWKAFQQQFGHSNPQQWSEITKSGNNLQQKFDREVTQLQQRFDHEILAIDFWEKTQRVLSDHLIAKVNNSRMRSNDVENNDFNVTQSTAVQSRHARSRVIAQSNSGCVFCSFLCVFFDDFKLDNFCYI